MFGEGGGGGLYSSCCQCPACDAVTALTWTCLASGIWILSIREHLFAPPRPLAVVDPAGEAIWLDPAPVLAVTGGVDG